MAINTEDGDYALDCWEDPETQETPTATEFSDDLEELQARAAELAAEGRFVYLSISEWDEETEEWEELESYEEDEDEAAA
ncbi:MAG TPA: hypothetical protein VG943_18810 [Caulobacterales bacterium]|nr:hypothetical protein [Caulobacterales bacterium]